MIFIYLINIINAKLIEYMPVDGLESRKISLFTPEQESIKGCFVLSNIRLKAKRITDEHNNARREEGASDMQLLVWDQDLADAAQEYVESCECLNLCEHGFGFNTSGRYGYKDWFPFGKTDGERFGQNLFFGFLDQNELSVKPVIEWHGEKIQYHYGDRNFYSKELYGMKTEEYCEAGWQCGHYTTVTWSDTTHVGCGYHICQGMMNVNCHYGPPGNKGVLPFRIGRKPFRLGDPCTDCSNGHGWCNDGLCIDCPNKNCDCPLKVSNMTHTL